MSVFNYGGYRIEINLENESNTRMYAFQIKANKIVLIPQQDRTKNTEPTRLIEGWNDYFWLKFKE
ncbi:hypothetical protein A9Q86_12860 [Flavobacteriales bacterium 33_180_T64]|nr:hypothetical protein A9Q86_12860 [Flavobacteriales bacterium 33_180_T64]